MSLEIIDPDEWPMPEIEVKFDWSMSMRDMEEKYLGKVVKKKKKSFGPRIPFPIPEYKITADGSIPKLLEVEKDLYSPKTTPLVEKNKFDKEAERQKKIREAKHSPRHLPPPIKPAGIPTFKSHELTHLEWLHRYNLEPEPSFHEPE